MASSTLHDYQHRLVNLELTLGDAYRHGVLDQASYQSRYTFLKQQQALLEKIVVLQETNHSEKDQEINLGLPNIEQCTPDERAITNEYLTDRRKRVEELYKTLSEVEERMIKVSEGTSFSFMHPFWLSKLKKTIAKGERLLNNQNFDNEQIEKMIGKFAGLTQSQPEAKRLKNSLGGLMTMFHELDQTSAQISHLKDAISSDEKTVAQMEMWLENMESQVQAPIRKVPPPPPQAANPILDQLPLSPLDRSEKNLTLARSFIEDCARETARKGKVGNRTTKKNTLTYFEALKSAVQLRSKR